MTTQLAYHPFVEHPPRFLEYGLPPDGVLTEADVHAFSQDPFWEYELLHGVLVVRSDGYRLTVRDLELFSSFPNWKYELLDGMLIVSPDAPNSRHQDCVLTLAILLRQACPPDLKVMIAPFEFAPGPDRSIQPDVLIARRPVALKRLTQAPVLVAEVLSASTKLFDLTDKRAFYAAEGVEHYWIVDPEGPSVEALRLVDGEYAVEVKADAGQQFSVSEPVALNFDPVTLLDA
jgi:Uma2 family endonuclease